MGGNQRRTMVIALLGFALLPAALRWQVALGAPAAMAAAGVTAAIAIRHRHPIARVIGGAVLAALAAWLIDRFVELALGQGLASAREFRQQPLFAALLALVATFWAHRDHPISV